MRLQTVQRRAGRSAYSERVLLLILQVAVLVFIAAGVLAIATVYVVRRRKVSYRHKIDPTLGTLGEMGMVPPTPLPEWAHWDESQHGGPDDRSASR
ncbi:hypothetical protein MGAD_41850 [Mycolicibacterium gadium]|uniref:Uncharacterized protein n=1 Tax=Mycolicibacterium gadium TaxID=1794 RepID=A0A7I7WRV8_MYCGU|nr:hypothetical protein MGAD_41850 [Mycolicibacterium gadium]